MSKRPGVSARFGFAGFATLLVSAIGGLIADRLGLPAGFLCGGALAVSLAALMGLKVQTSTPLRNVAFIIIGMTMGASVAKETLELLPQWPWSISGLVLALAIIIAIPANIFHKWLGFDRVTAFLATCPGHLSFIMGLSEDGHGDTRRIAVVQSIRLLVLTIAVPVVVHITAPDAHTPLPTTTIPLTHLALLATASAIGGFVLQKLRVPAGFVLGAMVVSTTAKLAGWFEGSVPAPLVIASFVIMGALIGARFIGITISELRASAVAGLVATGTAIGVVTLVALAISGPTDIPFGQLWIALAPGGLETMGALGLTFGYDTAFIAGHHAVRLLILGFAIPLGTVLLRRRDRLEAHKIEPERH